MHRFSSLLLCSLLACTRDEPTDTPNGPSAVGECESPEQILDARNEWTGFVRCADGSINRVEARAADTTIGGTPCPGEAPDTGFYVNGCDSDSECSGPADARYSCRRAACRARHAASSCSAAKTQRGAEREIT